MIRFDQLPNLPPGYVIEKAELIVAPESGYAKNVQYLNTGGPNNPVPLATMNTKVYEVTSAWSPTVNWGSRPSTGALLESRKLIYVDKPPIPQFPYTVTRFNLQTGPSGIVTNWLLGGANYGLELGSGYECGSHNQQYFCEAVFIPLTPNWKDADLLKLDTFLNDPPATYAAGGGFMLLITYAAPELTLGELLVHDVLPDSNQNMADAHHAYRLPASTSTWTAVGVKGLDLATYGDDTFFDPAGYLRLENYKRCPGSGWSIQPSEGDLALKPNYFLVRGNPADCAVQAWVDPPNPTAPANANLEQYAVQAVPSENLPGNPAFAPYTHLTMSLAMSTSDIIKLLNLNLQPSTRVGVRVQATTEIPGWGLVEVPYVEARVFSPAAANSTLVKGFHGEFVGGYLNDIAYGMGTLDVGSTQGGTWALALDYSGSLNPIFEDPPYSSTVPLTLFLEVEVVACPLEAIPGDNGCELVAQPDDFTDYIDVPPFRVFSPAGFDCNGSTCQTRPASETSPAPTIYWIADWNAGFRDRAVVVAGQPIFVDPPVAHLATVGQTYLAQFQAGAPPHLLKTVQNAYTVGVTNLADPDYGRLRPDPGAVYAGLPLSSGDMAGAQVNLNVDTQTAEAATSIHRDVLTVPGQPLEAFDFALRWHVRAEGYALSLGNVSVIPMGIPAQAQVASLTILLGCQWTMDFYPRTDYSYKPNGLFTDLRNIPGTANDGGVGAKIVNPPALGSDGHTLIDQYGSLTAAGRALVESGAVAADPLVGGDPTAFQHRIVSDPGAPTVVEPFTVTAYAGSFVAGLTWVQGSPDLTLIRPDGVEITPANASFYGVEVSDAVTRTLYGVPGPLAGVWQMKVSNAAANNDYHFIYLANKAIPDVDLLTPAGVVIVPANNTTFGITWSTPGDPPAGVDMRISLYYTASNTTAPTSTQTYGGVIRENLPLADGSYNWDLSSLAYGDYRVYARVYSGQPGNEPFQPAPTVTGTGQLPSDLWILAPGQVRLLDAVAPAVPTGLGLVPFQEGFWACWAHNSEKDLSGYVVRYLFPDVNGSSVERFLRVNAEVVEPNNWMQCARLGRFNHNELIIAQLAAYDASGNLSGYTDPVEDIAWNEHPAAVPVVNNLTAVIAAPGQVYLAWDPADLPPGSGYWVHWTRRAPLGLGQNEIPLLVDTNSTTLNLTPGFVHYFTVQAHDDWARLGLPSNRAALLLTDRVDGDADGLPDDWEAAYGADLPDEDLDRDGLSNAEELALLTDPQEADTDGDWFSDGLEVVGASDPLDGSQTPGRPENLGWLPPPRLSVSPTHLVYNNYTQAPNPWPRQVTLLNVGGGTITPTIGDDASWLTTVLNGDALEVQVDLAGLSSGFYRGTITVAADPSYTLDSPQQIVVDLWLFEGTSPVGYRVFLPLLRR